MLMKRLDEIRERKYTVIRRAANAPVTDRSQYIDYLINELKTAESDIAYLLDLVDKRNDALMYFLD